MGFLFSGLVQASLSAFFKCAFEGFFKGFSGFSSALCSGLHPRGVGGSRVYLTGPKPKGIKVETLTLSESTTL